ncbi:DUF6631 family protein [Vandammella animalimorsus]|uniref:Uncharacterized protein n=1 Tax=Vandammella animalimorsus TaxID=2029117 RepID=A0A2A2AW68_9BURK|nr:DUF6631 family protein [Vandammella animalimorsus]PAT41981.1 hypothetical protein CK621_11720 [Vandammella animalimorsus]RRD44829.1 hypothetical protein EII18_00310 [Comamonadaceae bacterium OH3737_COT-264]
MNDLDTLVPQGAEVTLAGETLHILPLKVGQMPAFVRAISPMMQQLARDHIDWLELFGMHGDALLTAVSIATGKPRTWIDALDADEAIVLAAKVIEVNADFFTRKVMPRLNQELGVLFAQVEEQVNEQAMKGTGSTPSST